MAEQFIEGEVRVRNVRTPESTNNPLGSLMDGGTDIFRMILGLFTLPFSILPPNTREQARNSVKNTIKSVVNIPGDLANVVNNALQDWANQDITKS